MDDDDKTDMDIIRITGNITLALKSIGIALLSTQTKDTDKVIAQVDDITRYADEIWQIYLRRVEGEDEQ